MASSQPPAFPVAYVRYHDHCWLETKELEKIRRAEPYVVEETGFLLVDNAEYITLARERSTDGEEGRTTYGDVTIILRSDILDLEVLGTPKGMGRPRRRASTNGHRAVAKAAARRSRRA